MARVQRTNDLWVFECPGCGCMHYANDHWQFNGNADRPTFSPSILVRGTRPVTDAEVIAILAGVHVEPVPTVCHSFVTDGRIQYLGDCTHEMAGQTVDLPDW